jgi:hypothetical protein
MSRAETLGNFKANLMKGSPENTIDELMESERDLCYYIEKISHQKVDDTYYAMKMEMFREALNNDPNYGDKNDK